MSTIQIIIAGAFVLLIAYFAISRAIRFKKKNKPTPNIIWIHQPMTYYANSREAVILELLNFERTKRKLKPFKADLNITEKAIDRTVEMDKLDKIDHSEAKDELLELKIDGSDGSADLISKYYSTPLSVVGRLPYTDKDGIKHEGYGWIGSTKHKKAIINARYDYCGISSYFRDNGRWIDVLMLVDEKTVN